MKVVLLLAVEDLGIGTEILGHATVREADGLAMSSRNALLSPEHRAKALALPAALQAADNEITAGGAVGPALERAKAKLLSGDFSTMDYLALVDSHTLEPLEKAREPMRLIAAASIGGVRLIDNIPVTLEQQIRR